jgi:hypothetical protein
LFRFEVVIGTFEVSAELRLVDVVSATEVIQRVRMITELGVDEAYE